VTWVDAFVGFFVAHMVGDYLLQTDWQARHKRGGLSGDRVALRALTAHVFTYTLAFVPVLVWIADRVDVGTAVLAGVLIALPHLVVDDGRLLVVYLQRVKRATAFEPSLAVAVDQAFHYVMLWAVAVLVGAS
jgi:hypothetical protein